MAKGGSSTQNYYDILKVRQDCTDKEIRTAYVNLSKKVSEWEKSSKFKDFTILLVAIFFLVPSRCQR